MLCLLCLWARTWLWCWMLLCSPCGHRWMESILTGPNAITTAVGRCWKEEKSEYFDGSVTGKGLSVKSHTRKTKRFYSSSYPFNGGSCPATRSRREPWVLAVKNVSCVVNNEEEISICSVYPIPWWHCLLQPSDSTGVCAFHPQALHEETI